MGVESKNRLRTNAGDDCTSEDLDHASWQVVNAFFAKAATVTIVYKPRLPWSSARSETFVIRLRILPTSKKALFNKPEIV